MQYNTFGTIFDVNLNKKDNRADMEKKRQQLRAILLFQNIFNLTETKIEQSTDNNNKQK